MTKVILELTEKEAEVLVHIMGSILGSFEDSCRKQANSIYAKIKRMGYNALGSTLKISGRLKCGDNPRYTYEDEEPNSSHVVPDKSMRIPRVSIGE